MADVCRSVGGSRLISVQATYFRKLVARRWAAKTLRLVVRICGGLLHRRLRRLFFGRRKPTTPVRSIDNHVHVPSGCCGCWGCTLLVLAVSIPGADALRLGSSVVVSSLTKVFACGCTSWIVPRLTLHGVVCFAVALSASAPRTAIVLEVRRRRRCYRSRRAHRYVRRTAEHVHRRHLVAYG